MRIVYLTAGSAGRYCGACMHDNTLATALHQAGDDVLLVPLYTPIRTDERDVSCRRVFFGGINVTLQQRWALFRHTPRWADRWLDLPAMLSWLGRLEAGTSPAALGAMTCSMLEGENGRQAKELDRLVAYLATQRQPDVIHLSNTLLAGTARHLAARFGVPVVASVAGEDRFVQRLPPAHRTRAHALLQARCRDLAALVAMNGYYADHMARYLAVSRARVHIIPPGLDLAGYGDRPASRAPDAVFTVGYLSNLQPDKGLHLLAEALGILAEQSDLPPLQLKIAGQIARRDRPYWNAVRRTLDNRFSADRCDYEYVGQLDRDGKISFLKSIDVFCLPAVEPESKGLPALEALASGVPVVLPNHGCFPEIVQETAGGLLFPAGDASGLARRLRRLVRDPALAGLCGTNGRQAVVDRHNAARMADRTRQLYRELIGHPARISRG